MMFSKHCFIYIYVCSSNGTMLLGLSPSSLSGCLGIQAGLLIFHVFIQ